MGSRPHTSLLTLLIIAAVILVSVCTGSARGLPAQEGIPNFGKVSDHLYRGAQPDSEALKHLKKLGVKLIVNLRMPGDAWKDEAAEATANGILYTNFPMSGTARPSAEQVQQILRLFESFAGPIFVHCQLGCDRTGTIVACYRIQHDRWSNALALREARHYGISRFEFLMRSFVRNFQRTNKPEPADKPDLRQARAN